jgi:hypothetical protein
MTRDGILSLKRVPDLDEKNPELSAYARRQRSRSLTVRRLRKLGVAGSGWCLVGGDTPDMSQAKALVLMFLTKPQHDDTSIPNPPEPSLGEGGVR